MYLRICIPCESLSLALKVFVVKLPVPKLCKLWFSFSTSPDLFEPPCNCPKLPIVALSGRPDWVNWAEPLWSLERVTVFCCWFYNSYAFISSITLCSWDPSTTLKVPFIGFQVCSSACCLIASFTFDCDGSDIMSPKLWPVFNWWGEVVSALTWWCWFSVKPKSTLICFF